MPQPRCVAGHDCRRPRGRRHIQVIAVHQNVMAARTRISHGHHDIARQFLFDVEVELLHSALLEIEILRLNGSRECSRVRLLGKNRESVGDVQAKVERPTVGGTCCRGSSAAPDRESELAAFREERGVLPQSLRALVPGGIVEDGIACPHRGLGAAKWLPRQSDAGFEGGLVQFNAHAAV